MQRSFGASGPLVPATGQGSWYSEQGDRREAIAAFRRGLDLGLTHIDTAEMHGDGRAEALIGEAIAATRFSSYRRCCRTTPRDAAFRPPASARSSS